MKPEYWENNTIGERYYYKIVWKRKSQWTYLQVGKSIINIVTSESWLITEYSKPCTEAAFMKRYNQTLKKIERAVAK